MCPIVKDINGSWPIYFLSFDDTGSKFHQGGFYVILYQRKVNVLVCGSTKDIYKMCPVPLIPCILQRSHVTQILNEATSQESFGHYAYSLITKNQVLHKI